MTRARPNGLPPILLIDDSADDLYIVTRLLQNSGIRNPIELARDGDEAIRFLSKGKASEDFRSPLAVFTDIAMPRRDGFAVLEWLSGVVELKTVLRVVISIFDDATSVRRAQAQGCHVYYRKYPTAAQCHELCSVAEAFARDGRVDVPPGPNLLHPRTRR
jgi:CheY-like chemotaxis protein